MMSPEVKEWFLTVQIPQFERNIIQMQERAREAYIACEKIIANDDGSAAVMNLRHAVTLHPISQLNHLVGLKSMALGGSYV